MASVTGMTVEGIEALMAENVVGLFVDDNGRIVYTRRDGSQIDGGLIANLNSPAFSGNPTAPTPAVGDNDDTLATTKFVKDQAYAKLASPNFTGNPTVPNVAAGDNDTTAANTAFVTAAIAAAKDLYKREGTVAERNAQFGIPTTDAQRIALANKRPVWFNTERGWAESYYVDDALSGANVDGLLPGVAAGWYPTGPGPGFSVSGEPAQTSNGYIYDKFSDFGVTASNSLVSVRRGGSDWFTRTASAVTIKQPGFYDLGSQVFFPNGTGVYVAQVVLRNAANTVLALIQQAVPLLGAYGQLIQYSIPRMYVPAGSKLSFEIANGSGTIRVFSHKADYISPALMYDN